MQNYNISSLPPSFSNLFLKFPDTYIKRYSMWKIQIPPPPASSRRGIRDRPVPFVQTRWLAVLPTSHLVCFSSHLFRANSHLFFHYFRKNMLPGRTPAQPSRRRTNTASTDGPSANAPAAPAKKKMSTASIPVANDLKTLSANQWDPHFQPAPLPDAPDAGGHRQAPLQTPP